MIEIKEDKIPSKAGWYFYKRLGFKKWQGIVEIAGKTPFLKINAWFGFKTGVTSVDFSDCIFSEEIDGII